MSTYTYFQFGLCVYAQKTSRYYNYILALKSETSI